MSYDMKRALALILYLISGTMSAVAIPLGWQQFVVCVSTTLLFFMAMPKGKL